MEEELPVCPRDGRCENTSEEAIFCYINLDSRPDRRIFVEEELRRGGIPKFTRIQACDGNSSEFKQRFSSLPTPHGLKNPRELACNYSHLKALRTGLDLATLHQAKYVVVMEDDLVVKQDFYDEVMKALQKFPSECLMGYLGYLNFFHDPNRYGESNDWVPSGRVFGSHCYCLRVEMVPKLITLWENSTLAADTFLDTQPNKYRLTRAIGFQQFSSASDISSEAGVAGTFYNYTTNTLKLKDIWMELTLPEEPKVPKILHVLPGQRLYFSAPDDWVVKEWKYHDEIHEFDRYGRKIPFEWWVIYYHGGVVFPRSLTNWLEKHYREEGGCFLGDLISGPRGWNMIKSKIREIVMNN
jgi:hypothetical protein